MAVPATPSPHGIARSVTTFATASPAAAPRGHVYGTDNLRGRLVVLSATQPQLPPFPLASSSTATSPTAASAIHGVAGPAFSRGRPATSSVAAVSAPPLPAASFGRTSPTADRLDFSDEAMTPAVLPWPRLRLRPPLPLPVVASSATKHPEAGRSALSTEATSPLGRPVASFAAARHGVRRDPVSARPRPRKPQSRGRHPPEPSPPVVKRRPRPERQPPAPPPPLQPAASSVRIDVWRSIARPAAVHLLRPQGKRPRGRAVAEAPWGHRGDAENAASTKSATPPEGAEAGGVP